MLESAVSDVKLKRVFNLETKKRLCEEWQKTNLNRSQFIRQNNLPKSFHTWCKQYLNHTENSGNQQAWIPLVAKPKPDSLKSAITLNQIEVKISCNNIAISLTIPSNQTVEFIKDLANATTVIR